MQDILYSTELIGLRVYDTRRRRIGRVKDAALLPHIDPERVDRFLVGGGWSWMTVRHDQVRSISLHGIYLRDEILTPYHSDEEMLRIERDVLDQQIVDAQGRKVVRVNDVTFEIRRSGEYDVLAVREVDIGVRSIVRRLLQGVLPPRAVRRLQRRITPNSIGWEHCNIIETDPQRRLRLNLSTQGLEAMHPADLADIVEELGTQERGAIFETLDSEVAAETLSEVDPDIQASILEGLETEKAAEIIEEMSPADAAHALAELEEETSAEILEEMEADAAPDTDEVRELLEYEEGTAGYLMNTDHLALPDSATVADAIAALRDSEEGVESHTTLFLVDNEERLRAAVPLARLLLAPSDTPLAGLGVQTVRSVPVTETDGRVIELFDKYNLLALPVVDTSGRLTGVITADDVISTLRQP